MAEAHPADQTLPVRPVLATVSHLELLSRSMEWADLRSRIVEQVPEHGHGTIADGVICTLALRQNVSSGVFSAGMYGW